MYSALASRGAGVFPGKVFVEHTLLCNWVGDDRIGGVGGRLYVSSYCTVLGVALRRLRFHLRLARPNLLLI